jgi:uncharacterized membrane protein YgcG
MVNSGINAYRAEKQGVYKALASYSPDALEFPDEIAAHGSLANERAVKRAYLKEKAQIVRARAKAAPVRANRSRAVRGANSHGSARASAGDSDGGSGSSDGPSTGGGAEPPQPQFRNRESRSQFEARP